MKPQRLARLLVADGAKPPVRRRFHLLCFLFPLFMRPCCHAFRITTIRRTAPDRVECSCRLCGETFSATYGLVLPGRIEQ